MAYESLLGEYEGKFKGVEGYSKPQGDACTVTISKSGLYGGSVNFAITGVDEILFEGRKVDEALRAGGREIRLNTPGGSGKDNEIVFMKLSGDGTVKFLKLTRKRQTAQHTEKSVSCGDLTKK
jgi:hypothetical protein